MDTSLVRFGLLLLVASGSSAVTATGPGQSEPRPKLRKWLQPQDWQRDVDGPILKLGATGEFDDTHVLAPCVAIIDDDYHLWYNGSTGAVRDRVFKLGLATGSDGRVFQKHAANPVFEYGDGKHSVVTTTLLRNADGSPIREHGKLRMWFSSTNLAGGDGHHALFETQSVDGVHWEPPSKPLLDNVYAPTVLKEDDGYRLWYTDVSDETWVFRMATSKDGQKWKVHPEAVLKPEAKWEQSRIFYPTVLKVDGVYLMWYGSYWSARRNTTAVGFAVSADGMTWYRNSYSPVLRPDPNRPWESHYTTSQSVIRNADGSYRIWYASRRKPPFVNKYFALNTATWAGPDQPTARRPRLPGGVSNADEFSAWQVKTRKSLTHMLGIPKQKVPLQAEKRGETRLDNIMVEKWVYTSEDGSRIPAVLYRPAGVTAKTPGVVLTFGHGGSKSHPCYQYIGQLYAKLGITCLAADPVGEEERHREGKRGTRAHDPADVHQMAWESGRPIMGKLVWDTMRGVDFLLSRDDVDPTRIGVAGNSLGGAKAGWMATLDSRLSFAIVSGWAFDDVTLQSKFCTKVPNQKLRDLMTWSDYLTLSAPRCRLLITNGDADVIIDRSGNGSAWRGTQSAADQANASLHQLGLPETIETWMEPAGGHRPYPAHPEVVRWLLRIVFPERPVPDLKPLNFGAWCDQHDLKLERLYGTPLHLRGATVVENGMRFQLPSELAVLSDVESGRSEFTLKGWLEMIISSNE